MSFTRFAVANFGSVNLIVIYLTYITDCSQSFMIADGFCNDETNNENCGFDGGDCCVNVNTALCTECNCFLQETCATGFHPLVGDGVCNDNTNIPECEYDGSDCCISPVIKDHCSHCECLGKLKTLCRNLFLEHLEINWRL